jgi:biotin synthase
MRLTIVFLSDRDDLYKSQTMRPFFNEFIGRFFVGSSAPASQSLKGKGLSMHNEFIAGITEKIIENPGVPVSYEQACELAAIPDGILDLVVCAGKIREKYKKNKVFACSIINAKSGFCSEDCAFCAQSAHHKTGVKTYPLLNKEEMVGEAVRMQDAGATKYSMVTSGFMLEEKEIETISNATLEIKRKTDLSICGSLGGLTESMARQLKESGISTYHHNLETARSYFDNICTTHDYDDDIHTIEIARSAGLRVCSGGILGMGESWDQRVELAFTLRGLEVDSIPLNFLNPIKGTRMENSPLLPPMEALKIISIFRIINPEKDITICGGRERTLKDFQSWIFLAGANGLMVGDYLTTEGRNTAMDMEMIEDMGLKKHGDN